MTIFGLPLRDQQVDEPTPTDPFKRFSVVMDYLQRMLDLALHKEQQGIHFWATVYVVVVLAGSLWHVFWVRTWPSTEGQLLHLGLRPLGTPDVGTRDQDYVPSALYRYRVNGIEHLGREISVWKVSASGLLRNTPVLLTRRVKSDASGRVRVFYHPRRPHRSLLLRPGWQSILLLSAAMAVTAGFYLLQW